MFDTQSGRTHCITSFGCWILKDAKRIDESKMIKSSIGNPRVMGVTKKIVHSINPERIPNDYFRQDFLPICKLQILGFLATDCEFYNIFLTDGRSCPFQ